MPGISSIPILGDLFRSKNFNHSVVELVIIVTATVVDPLTSSPLAEPEQPKMATPNLDSNAFDGRAHNLPKGISAPAQQSQPPAPTQTPAQPPTQTPAQSKPQAQTQTQSKPQAQPQLQLLSNLRRRCERTSHDAHNQLNGAFHPGNLQRLRGCGGGASGDHRGGQYLRRPLCGRVSRLHHGRATAAVLTGVEERLLLRRADRFRSRP